MTNLILEVYDAFKSVGVDDDAARKAAGALSGHEREIGDVRAEVSSRFDKVQAEMNSRFDKAQAKMNSRFDKAETNSRLGRMQAEIISRFDQMSLAYEKRFSRLEAEQLVVRALFAILIAGVASLIVKTFF